MFKKMKEKDGSATVLGIIGSLFGGLSLLVASQLFQGVNKANADIAELKTKEAIEIADLKKDVVATRAGIDVLLEIEGRDNPKVLKYKVEYPNLTTSTTTVGKK